MANIKKYLSREELIKEANEFGIFTGEGREYYSSSEDIGGLEEVLLITERLLDRGLSTNTNNQFLNREQIEELKDFKEEITEKITELSEFYKEALENIM